MVLYLIWWEFSSCSAFMRSLRCKAVGRGRPEVMVWLVVWAFRWRVRLIERIWGAGRFLL